MMKSFRTGRSATSTTSDFTTENSTAAGSDARSGNAAGTDHSTGTGSDAGMYGRMRRSAVSLYKKCLGVMIVFMFLWWVIKQYILFPAAAKIWSLTLSTIPSKYITNANIYLLLKYPWLPVIRLLLVMLYCAVTIWEMSGIILCFAGYDRGKTVRFIPLLVRSLTNIKHLARPKNWLFFIYIMLILPLTDLYSAAGMVSSFAVPEYISDYILSNNYLLLAVFAGNLFMIWLAVRWFYVLQAVLIRGMDVRAARRESVQLMKGRTLRQCLDLVFYSLERIVKIVLLPLAASYAVIGLSVLLTRNMTGLFLAVKGAYYDFFRGIFYAAASLFLKTAVMSYLVCSYRIAEEARGTYTAPELPDLGSLDPGTGSPRPGTIRSRIFSLLHLSANSAQFSFRFLQPAIYTAAILFSLVYFICILVITENDPGYLESAKTDVLVAAHKGYSSEAPENTMAAFEKAAEDSSVDLIELDIRESKDGIPIVIHNESLKDACGVNESVYDLDYEDIRKLTASYDFADSEFPDSYVPTLEEVLQTYGGEIFLLIEIKMDSSTPDLPEKIVDLIHRYDCGDMCAVHSGSYPALEAVKAADASIPCGYIIALGDGAYYNLPCADFFSVEHNFVTASLLKKVHSLGKKVYAWTVNDPGSVNDMLVLDVDAVITDYPDAIYEQFYSTNELIDDILKQQDILLPGTKAADDLRQGCEEYQSGDY